MRVQRFVTSAGDCTGNHSSDAIYPVIVGGGTPLLPPVTKHVELHLVETRTFGARVVYERYVRA